MILRCRDGRNLSKRYSFFYPARQSVAPPLVSKFWVYENFLHNFFWLNSEGPGVFIKQKSEKRKATALYSSSEQSPLFLTSWAKDGRVLAKYQAAGGEAWDVECWFPLFFSLVFLLLPAVREPTFPSSLLSLEALAHFSLSPGKSARVQEGGKEENAPNDEVSPCR